MTSAPKRRSWPRRMLNRLEVDQAVFFALAVRGWQMVAGVVSLLVIAIFFSPQVQGFYYTFASLTALQTFFELGFTVAVISLSSHEWAHLRMEANGAVEGDALAKARLGSLVRWMKRWYFAAAMLFLVVVGLLGARFLGERDVDAPWQGPWAATVAASAVAMWCAPFAALLEGCGQAAIVNRFRLAQAVLASLAFWSAAAAGAGLWAAAAASVARAGCDLYLLLGHRKRFFESLASAPGQTMNWRHEIWPLQWRMAVQGVLGYFAYALFTPVMFEYHGAEAAGRMGMTWGVITILQAAALSWVQARAGLLGTLAARRDYQEFDRVFFRVTGVSWVVIAVAGAAMSIAIVVLGFAAPDLAQRLLPVLPATALAAAVVIYHLPHCQAIYVRAHKREPFLLFGVTNNLAIGAAVWLLGREWEATGAALGYLGVVALFSLPVSTYLWLKCRQERAGDAPRGARAGRPVEDAPRGVDSPG